MLIVAMSRSSRQVTSSDPSDDYKVPTVFRNAFAARNIIEGAWDFTAEVCIDSDNDKCSFYFALRLCNCKLDAERERVFVLAINHYFLVDIKHRAKRGVSKKKVTTESCVDTSILAIYTTSPEGNTIHSESKSEFLCMKSDNHVGCRRCGLSVGTRRTLVQQQKFILSLTQCASVHLARDKHVLATPVTCSSIFEKHRVLAGIMMLHRSFSAIYVALLLAPVIVSTNIIGREALSDSVPWFIVNKYQDESNSNVSTDAGIHSAAMSTSTILALPPSHYSRQSVTVCQTNDCRVAAKNFITNMDSTVDPCDDFFGYVCGGWPSAHPLPPSESSFDQFTSRSNILSSQLREILEEEIDIADLGPVKSAKRAYRACMNLDAIERKGIEPILSILDQNGGWPITMDASRRHARKLTWQQIEENYSREYDTDSIYGITVDVDLKNASVHSIYMDQASTILPRSIIVDEQGSSSLINDYAKYVEDVASAFARARRSLVPRTRIVNDAKAIVYFEVEIAKITSPDEMRRDINRLYNLKSIRRLQNWYDRARPRTSKSKMNWLKTIQNHFNEDKINVQITDKVVVMEVDYYFKLAALLDKTPTRTIVNYVHWRMVNSLLSSTTKQMRDIIFEMEKSLFGVEEQRERWMTCVSDNNMKHAISYQYVNKFVTDVAKKTASNMVTEMQKEFEGEISRSNWMDDATKIAAKGKLNSMKRFISHPDWYQNQTAMIHYYKGLVVTQDHFENTLSFKKYEHRKEFRRYKSPVEQDVWSTAPTTINAFYDPSMNSLTFPAGILQTPFFSPNVPDALNYGSIGAVIGHEISHGFDDVGRQFDKSGNAEQWWSDSTIKDFTARAQCFIDQYNNYTIQEITTESRVYHANGELNQGENIADATGLQASYQIFKRRSQQNNAEEPRLLGLESFTHDQLFFISYGNTWCESVTKEYLAYLAVSDAHPTNRLRVTGTLGNSEEFNKAFNCPVGSTMNRAQKCNLWK